MIKIFIIGYQHSGTTLLHQLLKAHPQVGWIENEENYIEYDKDKHWVEMMAKKKVADLKKFAWGEKTPWIDVKGHRIISLCNKWCKYFKRDARILHIIRNPLDVCLSLNPNPDYIRGVIDIILRSLPVVINYLNSNRRAATIVFEDLVCDPENKLESILNFLGLETNDKIIKKIMSSELKFGKINSDRALKE